MSQDFLGPNQNGPDVKRLVFAVVLMTATLMLFNLFVSPTPAKVGDAQAQSESADKAPVAAVEQKEAPKALESSSLLMPSTPDTLPRKDKTFQISIDTPTVQKATALRGYDAVVSNFGGQITKLDLVGYEEPIALVQNSEEGRGLFILSSPDQRLSLHPNSSYQIIETNPKSISLERMTEQGIRVRRRIDFDDQNFQIGQVIVVKNESPSERNFALDIGFSSPGLDTNRSKGGYFSSSPETLSAVCRTGEDRELATLDNLKESTHVQKGKLVYAGIDQQYFLTALMPKEGTQVEGCEAKYWSSPKDNVEGAFMRLRTEVTLMPGESKELAFASYMGPKQLGLLQAAGHQLEENINFGWFGVLARPMLWLLSEIFGFVGNFGIAIILLTLFIKLLTFPLTQKSFVSMQAMKKVAPQLKEIQKKYSHDRVLLGQKQMELYKEAGINPMAGCLPLLIQMPIWFALYQMLWNSVELHQQPFALWIHDLTRPDPLYVMPIVMGISMFVQQYFQPTPDDNPQMKYMMWGMPFFLTFVMLSLPAGLSLYILTNNVLTIFQQLYIKRKYAEA